QSMYLVDEQHVVRLEVREQRSQVAGPLEHRSRGLPQIDAELVRDDVRERRLAQARRPEQQRVIERLAALPRGRDEDVELRFHAWLADVLGELAWTNGAIERLVFLGGERRDDVSPFLDGEWFAHRSATRSRCTRFSASRIISSVL